MRAAIVADPGKTPAYAFFEDPVAAQGEALIAVSHAARTPLAKAQAAGLHYAGRTRFPFIPGVDGVGKRADGTRVYFAFPRAPYGSMAQNVPVDNALCVPLPEDLDDATAAAAGNPGMSSWAALTLRAKLRRGENVLINGATGVSGRLAVQVAKRLGARRIVATGRDAAMLRDLCALGVDATISLNAPSEQLIETFRDEMRTRGVDVILDYLWGLPATHLLEAAAGEGTSAQAPRIRYVQIGSSAGATVSLHAKNLRGSGLELMGSGLGSIAHADLVAATGDFLRRFKPDGFSLETRLAPLAEIERLWDEPQETRERLVFRI